jgi:signal transduction histidine kinase
MAFADGRRQVRLDRQTARQRFAILEPTGAVVQMSAAIAGTRLADDPVGRFIWDLLLWDEPTRELLRHHIVAIADGSDGPHELRVRRLGSGGPGDLTLRPIRADDGRARAIVLETTGVAGTPSDPQEMIPRQFVEDVAHQLNNALASVMGNIELIERRSQDNEAVMARIPRAREALERAFTLIQFMRM